MNPKPSLIQCLVLHDIADDGVWFDLASGRWHSTHLVRDVSVQVEVLLRGAYIKIVDDQISVTPIGKLVLDRRPLGELLERINR